MDFYEPGEERTVRDPVTGMFPPLNRPVRHYSIDGLPYSLLTPERLVKDKGLLVPRRDDVLVTSYPRSGTGFTLSLCMEIHKIHLPDLPVDHPFFAEIPKRRTPWVHNKIGEKEVNLGTMASPRVMKTHNHYQHLNVEPGSLRIIHVMRNPKDVACSQHFHMLNSRPGLLEYEGTFNDTVKYFLDGGFATGCYWRFNKEYMVNKDGHNILRLCYEDLTTKRGDSVRKINAFLGYGEMSDEQVMSVIKATSLDYTNLKENQVGKPGKALAMMTLEQRGIFDDRSTKEFVDMDIPQAFLSENGYLGL